MKTRSLQNWVIIWIRTGSGVFRDVVLLLKFRYFNATVSLHHYVVVHKL